MGPLRIKQLALIAFLVFACQEDVILEDPANQIDEDMISATALAEEFMNSKTGRTESLNISITILQYKKGKLYFNTNSDRSTGYNEIYETSITAYAEPGEYIFWYAGSGISDLESIDFDSDASSYLDSEPYEICPDKLWVIRVPLTYDPSHSLLKYDIVYESRDNVGNYIRLDPKIQVQN